MNNQPLDLTGLPAVPRLHGGEHVLHYLTGTLMPAVREFNADRLRRRTTLPEIVGDVGSPEWFATSLVQTVAAGVAADAANKRDSSDFNVTMARACYVASLMHTQFTGGYWWTQFHAWAQQLDVTSGVRRELNLKNFNSHRHPAMAQPQYIANDTDTKLHKQLAEICRCADIVGVDGWTRLQCNMICNGVNLTDALADTQLVAAGA